MYIKCYINIYIKCYINISDNLLDVQGTVSQVLKSSLTIISIQAVKSLVLYMSALKNMQIKSYRKFDHSTQIFGEKKIMNNSRTGEKCRMHGQTDLSWIPNSGKVKVPCV